MCVPGMPIPDGSQTVVPAQKRSEEIRGAANRVWCLQRTCWQPAELGINGLSCWWSTSGSTGLWLRIPQQKIVGPGNLFVALAKKEAYGVVDIDSFAGPSEVIVIADQTARADYVAADLLAQAEHSPGSAILITWDQGLLDAVHGELIRQLASLTRNQLTLDSLEAFGALILVQDQAQACELTDQFAPEHLHIQTRDPRQEIELIRNSGAAFLGHHTPVALGDYAATRHVLPTGGTCTWAAGLCSNSFLRSSDRI